MVDSWRGHIAEQITAQELLALEDRVGQHRSFWARPNNGAEVDFVIAHDSKLYPIEVKSGTNAHLRSLQVFMDNSDADIAIRIWSKPYSVDNVQTRLRCPLKQASAGYEACFDKLRSLLRKMG